jgi:multidrug transporter EmrE-like cation transporter
MKQTEYVLVIASVLGVASGQLMFKQAALVGANRDSLIQAWLTNGWLWCAAVAYFVSTIGWIWSLRTVPLSVAYPFMAIAFIVVPVASHLLFGEPLRAHHIVGLVAIVVGLLFIQMQ